MTVAVSARPAYRVWAMVHVLTVIAGVALALGLETGWIPTVLIPGHRAFPAVFCAVLLVEQLAWAWAVVGVCAVGVAAIMAMPTASWMPLPVWLLAALGAAVARRLRRPWLAYPVLGAAIGWVRLILLSGMKSGMGDQWGRVLGHLAFGALAGAMGYAISRVRVRP